MVTGRAHEVRVCRRGFSEVRVSRVDPECCFCWKDRRAVLNIASDEPSADPAITDRLHRGFRYPVCLAASCGSHRVIQRIKLAVAPVGADAEPLAERVLNGGPGYGMGCGVDRELSCSITWAAPNCDEIENECCGSHCFLLIQPSALLLINRSLTFAAQWRGSSVRRRFFEMLVILPV